VYENKNENISPINQQFLSQNELLSRWENPALVEILGKDINSFEFSNQISVESFVSFLMNADVVGQFAKMNIDEESIQKIASFAQKVGVQNRSMPLLTVFNTLCHGKSKKKAIVIAVFNKYIALTHKQHEQQQDKRENFVNTQQENKAFALKQIEELRKKYSQTPQDEMPIYIAGIKSATIESIKTQPRFNINVIEEVD
jgi:hypothetical protein